MTILGFIGAMGVLRLFLIDKKHNNFFINIMAVLLFMIAATRSIYFGPDVIGYVNSYIELESISLSYLIGNLFSGNIKDPVFYILSKIISLAGVDYRLWLAILSGFFIFSVTSIIKKYSPYPLLSFISLISLGYFYFSLTGLRQAVALSIILLSYPYLREKKWIPFIMIVLIASLFHASALVFLISYPMVRSKLGVKHIIGIIAALIASLFLGSYIRNLIFLIGWTDTLTDYAFREVSLSYSGFIIQLAIFLFCLYFSKNVLNKNEEDLSFYNLLFLGLIFQAFASEVAEFFRISMYFSIFSIILIPKAIVTIRNKKIRVLVYLIVTFTLIAYIIWSKSFDGFQFFWNDVNFKFKLATLLKLKTYM